MRQSPSGRSIAISSLVVAGVIAVIALVVLMSAFTIVDAGNRGVLKTFGEVTGTFDPGFHFRTPFVTSVVDVDVKTQRLESESSAASKDLQFVTTKVVLNYRPDPDTVAVLVRDIGTDYQTKVIDPAIQESVKAATAQYTAEELITQRPLVSQSIKEVLLQRLAPRGILVEDLSITEFNFSPEFSRAIESKQVAEQDALRAERELRRVQIEAQQRVAQAEADAKAKLVVAQAEAESLRLQREVISPALLQLRYIEKWNGVLPRFTSGDSGLTPLINIAEEDLEPQPAEPAPAAAPTPATTPAEPVPTPAP
jgi:regulator of protease activity HflC (stomatin/prohibitin superfamily)